MNKYFALLLIPLNFGALTYASAPQEFLLGDLLSISILIISAWLIQSTTIYCLERILKPKLWLINALAASFCMAMVYSLNWSINEYFLTLPVLIRTLIWFSGFFIVHTVLTFSDENRDKMGYVNGFFVCALIVTICYSLLGDREKSDQRNYLGVGDSEQRQTVDFYKKPNVYMVSFDSLQSRALIKKYMNLDGVAYNEVLERNFFSMNNFFADRVPTKSSLNSLLALDLTSYDLLSKRLRYQFFTGHKKSPLFEIFKHNGYTTNTLYASEYFGKSKGPFLDNYFIGSEFIGSAKGMCEFNDKNKLHILLGACYIKSWKASKSIEPGNKSTKYESRWGYLIPKLRSGLSSKGPQIFLAYIYSPGHTPKGFLYTDNRGLQAYKKYLTKNSEKTKTAIKELIDFIDNEDPGSILYVFGDHGSYLSRKVKRTQNPEFVIQDRYGVYGGFYPSDACPNQFEKSKKEKFMTISKGALLLVDCLTNGAASSTPIQYLRSNDEIEYEKYLYE